MTRRDRQRTEIEHLCESGAVARAVDLAFGHFADFGRDEGLVDRLGRALDRTTVTPAVRRRFTELRDPDA
jgi:hypothetical protein